METIRKEEMLLILGGYDEEKCKDVQGRVSKDMSAEEWEQWLKDFDEFCI